MKKSDKSAKAFAIFAFMAFVGVIMLEDSATLAGVVVGISALGMIASVFALLHYSTQEKEARFLTLCKVHPRALKDAMSERRVVEAMTALQKAVADAAQQLEAIDAADALQQEAQRAFLDTRKRQLHDMLALVQEFKWV